MGKRVAAFEAARARLDGTTTESGPEFDRIEDAYHDAREALLRHHLRIDPGG